MSLLFTLLLVTTVYIHFYANLSVFRQQIVIICMLIDKEQMIQ